MEFIKAFDKDVYNHPVVYDGDPLIKGPSITYAGKMYIGIDFGKEINELQQNQFNRGKSREIFNKFKKNTGSPIELYNGKDVLQSLVKQFGVKFSKETLNDTKYFDVKSPYVPVDCNDTFRNEMFTSLLDYVDIGTAIKCLKEGYCDIFYMTNYDLFGPFLNSVQMIKFCNPTDELKSFMINYRNTTDWLKYGDINDNDFVYYIRQPYGCRYRNILENLSDEEAIKKYNESTKKLIDEGRNTGLYLFGDSHLTELDKNELLLETKYFDLAGNVDKSHDEYDYLQFNNFNEALKVLQEANKMVTTINNLKKPESEKCGLMAIEFGNTKLFKTISESAKN